MKRFYLLALFLMFVASQLLISSSASAKTIYTEKEYSVGFMLDEDTCFFEDFEMPDEIDALFTIQKKVDTSRRGTKTTYKLYREGNFGLSTHISSLKVRKNGFTARGKDSHGAQAFKETITVKAPKKGGLATLTIEVITAGSSCKYVYSGVAAVF